MRFEPGPGDGSGAASGKRPNPNPHDQRLSKKQRLVRPSEFQEAYQQGNRWVTRTMVLWLREGPDAALRVGVVASRKVGNAVARARAKRRLREAYRLNRHRFRGEVDVVLVARGHVLRAPWQEVVDDLLSLSRKAGLLAEEDSK